jgi:hypothetical protein
MDDQRNRIMSFGKPPLRKIVFADEGGKKYDFAALVKPAYFRDIILRPKPISPLTEIIFENRVEDEYKRIYG